MVLIIIDMDSSKRDTDYREHNCTGTNSSEDGNTPEKNIMQNNLSEIHTHIRPLKTSLILSYKIQRKNLTSGVSFDNVILFKQILLLLLL